MEERVAINNHFLQYCISSSAQSPFYDLFQELQINSKYHTEDTFCDFVDNSTNLNIVSINIQAIQSKFNDLKSFLDHIESRKKRIDIILIQETYRFNPDLHNLRGYTLFADIRPTGNGGGCCIYVNENFVCKKITLENSFIPHIIETTITQVEIPDFGKIIAVSCYRPPYSPFLRHTPSELFNLVIDHLSNLMNKLEVYNCPIIIGGDFNINLLDTYDGNNVAATQFTDTMVSYGFIPYINRATRIDGETFSLLDNIFINDHFERIAGSGIIVNGLSDHFIPFLSIKARQKRQSGPAFKEVRKMDLESKTFLKEALANRGWHEILSDGCPNSACDKFMDTFMDIFDICCPLKKVKINKNITPRNGFMTRGLLVSRKRKLKLAYKAIHSTNPNTIGLYRQYRNIYNHLIRAAKKQYYSSRIAKAGDNAKEVWRVLKEAINIKSKKSNIGPIRDRSNGSLVTDDAHKADLFNQVFAEVGREATNNLPTPNKDFKDYLPPPIANSIYMHSVTPDQMRGFIKSLKSKHSVDINGISTNLLQFVAEEISLPLAHIFNLSIDSGIFPERLKISKTVAIFKSGDHLDTNNYRGVSLIDNVSKIFEKIIASKVIKFLDRENFFYENQFGFRTGMSTNMAILKVTNFISRAMNDGKYALAIFLDIKKAFDSVDRDILFYKLNHCGIRGVANNLFRSYFAERKQTVVTNGKKSNLLLDITLGVLQGSILGVLLFLIFINDLQHSCSELLNILFADDETGLIAHESLDELITKSNSELDKLFGWYNANKLAIHPGKSRLMIFYPPSRPPNLPVINGHHYFPLYLNYNERLPNNESNPDTFDISKVKLIRLIPNADESSFKLLGVLLDCNLNLKDQTSAVSSKVAKSIFAINQMKHYLDKEHLTLLANAYIRSHLEYCCNIYSMCNQTTIRPLTLLLKRTVRTVASKNRFAHTKELFKDLNILPVPEMIEYNVLKFMHKFVHGNLPSTFDNTWDTNVHVSQRQTRQASDIHLIAFQLEYFRKMPLFSYPNIWNNIPNNLKLIVEEDQFNVEVRKHLFANI